MGDILPSIYLPNFCIYAKHHRLSYISGERALTRENRHLKKQIQEYTSFETST